MRISIERQQFALFVLSPPGQKILADHGFDAPLLIPALESAPGYNCAVRTQSESRGGGCGYTKVATKADTSLGLHLRYAFEPGEQRGATLGNPLFDLLGAVLELGSIRHAAQVLGMLLPLPLGLA